MYLLEGVSALTANQYRAALDSNSPVQMIRLGRGDEVKREALRGTARVAEQGGDEYRIAARDVRRFVIANAAAIDLRKVEKFWFIELLAGGTA
jgi:hypothetical protein